MTIHDSAILRALRPLLVLLALGLAMPAPEASADGWARAIGGKNREWAVGVAADAAGRVVVLGHFHGETRPGDGLDPLHSAGDSDLFLVQWGPSGEARWARRFGGVGQDEGKAVTVADDGTIYVTGFFSRSVELAPGHTLDSAGSADLFVLALDADGELLWARRFGGPAGDVGYDIAVGPGGDLWVTGYFQASVDWIVPNAGASDRPRSLPLRSTSAGSTDAFLLRLDRGGRVLDARTFGGAGADQGRAVVVAPDGEVALCANFRDVVAWKGNRRVESEGDSDVVIWRLAADGSTVRDHHLGGAGADSCEALALDADGTLYAVGSFFGEASIGDRRLTSQGGTDVFVLAIEPDDGVRWAHQIGQPAADLGYGARVVDGHLVVAGFSQLPRETASFSGEADGFVVTLGAAGEVRRTVLQGDPAIQALALATAADGGLYVTGMFRGGAEIDVGCRVETLPGIGKFDIFLARLEAPTP